MNTTSKLFMAFAVVLLTAAIVMPSVQEDGSGFNNITPAAGGESNIEFNLDAEAFPPAPAGDIIQVPARVNDATNTLDEQAALDDEGLPTDVWGNSLADIEPAAGGTATDLTPPALQ